MVWMGCERLRYLAVRGGQDSSQEPHSQVLSVVVMTAVSPEKIFTSTE